MAKTNLIAAIAVKLSGANLFSYLSANHSKGNEKNETMANLERAVNQSVFSNHIILLIVLFL